MPVGLYVAGKHMAKKLAKKKSTKKKQARKKAKKKETKRMPNRPGVGRVTAKGQRIEELTGFKQKRFGKK